ncbi:MAG TPA: tetratricopeptide repeat protein [Kiritimatiellia bacterium]|nr:tetratricopeptide repeat protein [Kiritimatiellia bacterium]HMO98634.1 tetratricopeptide repeat protein [Kiritimatiellia bacterium]HMP96338.1 tetratricopeptide repeat protein [Kiritimatiellia bacterium]
MIHNEKKYCRSIGRFAGALLVAGLLLPVPSAVAQVVILPNGNRIEGSDIRAQRNGDIILTTPAGQRTFARGTYAKAIAAKPPAFDQARALAGQGKHDEAIGMLEKIATDFRFLDWDNNALMAIGQIQTSRGNHKDAVDVYERLLRQSPELKDDGTVQWTYRGALLAAGLHEKLAPMLEEAIKSGSRADAAKAQVMRGDVRLAQGQVETAAMDYLRTAILFESEAAVVPEALFKAGQALDRLRDPRAKDMYRRLVQNFPQSTFAQEARSKL